MGLFDNIKRSAKVVRERLADRKKKKQDEQEQQNFLDNWKQQFEIDRRAKSAIDSSFDAYEEYYQGKRRFGNLKDEGYNQNRDVRTVINFVRTPIEALIDLSVPQPDLTARALDDEYAVNLMNKYVDYVCKSANLEEINLANERRVKKFGGGFYKVHWNNQVKFGSYVGDIEISDPHPIHVIPNAGALNWDNDLEHYHHIVNQTEKYALRRWPKITKEDLEDKAVFYSEYDELNDGASKVVVDNTTTYSTNKDTGLKRWTIIETTYRDEDGDICKFWWSGDLLLDHIEKFYWHRNEKGEPIDHEILEPETMIRSGQDEMGEPIYKPLSQIVTDPELLVRDEFGNLIGVKVDYYIPTSWDIVYQPYLPKDLSCWGTSMIDDIKDLYEAALKAVYIQEESFLRGRKKIVTDNDEDAKKIMDPGSEVVKVMGNVREIDINTNIDGVSWVEWLWGKIQLITGATNAAMGIHDAGVKSGRQAQLYVSQANFKASIASAYKAIAYKKLYRIVADFAMAFCDDDRPFRLAGEKNKPEYGTFSRLAMLRDDSGNIVYPNWDINISCENGFMQNKTEVLNAVVQLASQRAFEATPGNVAYLKILQKLGMPHIDSAVAELEGEVNRQKQMAEQQQQMLMRQQQMQKAQQNQQPGITQGVGPPQSQQQINPEEIIKQLPPQQREVFLRLFQTDPQKAIAMLQQVLGGEQNGGQTQQQVG